MAEALLVEIGCEELPARHVAGVAEQFARRLEEKVAASELLAESGARETAWTPRRLLVRLPGVATAQRDKEEQTIGPPVRIGVGPDGAFTAQAIGFATRLGAPASALQRVQTPRGEYVAVTLRRAGRPALEVLAELIPEALGAVELPRSMSWQSGTGPRFLRPIRWLLALLGEQVVPLKWGGLQADRVSRGHRTLGAATFAVGGAGDFPASWRGQYVTALPDERRGKIAEATTAALAGLGGGLRARADAVLEETLVNLTEYPDAVAGNFDPALLQRLPDEVLVTVMRDHQKYFAVEDAQGRLAPHFLAITNNRAEGETGRVIRHGHERVLRARFNDAQFFYDADRRHPLAERLHALEGVTFHVALGSYRQKASRMTSLARWLAESWHAGEGAAYDAAVAAELAKCDLTTEMVKELPELQGVMGGLYARAEGRPEAQAVAIYDHYRPSSATGELPRTMEGRVVAVADKLDSVAGLVAIGELPRGSGDPWALRRQANGILRIVLTAELPLSLAAACNAALAGYQQQGTAGQFRPLETVRQELAGFFRERLAWWLRESGEGLAYDTVNAVLAAGADDPVDARARARALERARRQMPAEFAAIATSLKRIRNIVRKEGGQEQWQGRKVEAELLREPAEVALQQAVTAATALRTGPYFERLLALGTLAAPLELFFQVVRVNAEDAALRANRLALLAWAAAELDAMAYFSEIVVAGGTESAARG